MLMTRNLVAGCLPALLLACSAGGDDSAIPASETLHERMRDGLRFFVSSDSGSVTVTGSDDRRAGQTLAILDGELALGIGADDEVVLDDFEVALEDAHVSLLGFPLHLTGIRASLAEPAPGQGCWSTTLDDVTIDTAVDLRLEWALALDGGGILRLATQRIENIAVHVRVVAEGDRAVALLEARNDGTFWEWDDLAQLANLKVRLVATEIDYSVEP
jgi:hypothetical protein